MSDLSAAIAKMLIEGEEMRDDMRLADMVDCILERWPAATLGEIHRGFLIAIETALLDEAMEDPR